MDSTAQMNTWFESVPLYFWNTVCSIDKRLKLEENKIMSRAGYCWRCEAPCTQHCSRCGMAYYCSKRCQQQDKWRHKPDCDAAALKMQCSGCNAKQEGMLKCTNCLNSYYCNAGTVPNQPHSIQGNLTSIFGKYLFGGRFKIQFSCLPASRRIFEHLKNMV